MRRSMLCVSDTIDKVVKMPGVSADDQRLLKKLKSDMLSTIEYAPVWIIMAVALALLRYRYDDWLAPCGSDYR